MEANLRLIVDNENNKILKLWTKTMKYKKHTI